MARVLRVSVGGALPGGEKWSINPCFSFGDFDWSITSDEATAMAQAIADVAVPTGLRNAMSNGTTRTTARVEARDLTGELEVQGEANSASLASGLGTNIHTFQSAWVCSLRTTVPGASGRGRVYWPATGQQLGSNSRPATSAVTDFLTGMSTYLDGMRDALAALKAGATLVVWSRTRAEVYPVNRLQAGDVLDSQRRRRDTLIETYQSVVWTP